MACNKCSILSKEIINLKQEIRELTSSKERSNRVRSINETGLEQEISALKERVMRLSEALDKEREMRRSLEEQNHSLEIEQKSLIRIKEEVIDI